MTKERPKKSTRIGRNTPDPRRSINVERVLEALRVDGPSSQAGLARKTGLSAATINAIVRDLQLQGTAEIRPLNGREGVVTLVAGTGVFLALEVSAHAVHGAVFDFSGRHRGGSVVDDRSDVAAALAIVDDLTTSVPGEVDGIAVAIQAPIDSRTGAITEWCNSRLPGWADVRLNDTFDRAIGQRVVVDNDSNLAALAEWTWGVGRGVDDFLYLRASSGVGGGVIINGSIYHGGNGMAGDMGHVAIDASGEVCYCGSRGCLTTLVSEQAIVDAVRTSPGVKSNLRDVIDAARRGDAACQRVLAEAGEHLGRALANAAKVLAPSVIAVGGELGSAGPLVFNGLRSSIELSNLRAGSSPPKIEAAAIGPDAALLGGLIAILAASGKGMSELEPWMTDTVISDVFTAA